ncbi:low specificity L-threonine aldolase [Oscillospiraceae bacterium PP1C4]
MYSFKNDYSEGAHPRIIDALVKGNLEQTDGYGRDPHSENAARLIKKKINRQDVDVHLLVGGTQTNLTVITAALRPHQAVIAVQTGHVCLHETGAIEATGHKVVAMTADDGKLTPALIQSAVDAHTDEHMVQPKLVYISHSSELGTIYSKAELEAIRTVCDANGLYLFVDGARLASALTAQTADITLPDLARLADVFYLGGTKSGALFGEALVIVNDALKPDFRFLIKQRGGMLAKGRLLGIQFECLFADDLYLELGVHANRMAMRLKDAFTAAGVSMLSDSYTNQQFPILPDTLIEKLRQDYKFEIQQKLENGMTAVRFVTSWATVSSEVDAFIACFNKLIKH